MRYLTLRNAIYGTLTVIMLFAIAYQAHACTAFLKGERTSGMNKICYYDPLGSEVAVTVRSIDLCKLSIRVQH